MSAKPTEMLKTEHRLIEKVLGAMRRHRDALLAGQAVDAESLSALGPFMSDFADAYHHGKEELRLFPRLVQRGLPPAGGPVQVMCAEHETGRHLVGALKEAVAAYAGHQDGAAQTLADAMAALIDFYTSHIWKEDNILFPMAENVLGAEDVADLLAAFAEVDGKDGAARYQAFVDYAESLG